MHTIDERLEQFKKEFYDKKVLKIDTTKYLGDDFPLLYVKRGVTEKGNSFVYDESNKILVICTIIEEKEYFGDFINVNPEIFHVDNVDNAWEAIQSRIMLDYNLSKLR